jgi:hypothetical protein
MRDSFSFLPTLAHLEKRIVHLSDVQLAQPFNNKWSILQHLYHCWMVERGVLAYIKLKTQDPNALVKVSLKTKLKFYLFFALLRLGWLRAKAPKVVQDFPKKMSREDLFAQWNQTREAWHLFLTDLQPEVAQKGVFKHIFIGRLNKPLTLKFLAYHLLHHLRLCKLQTN